jgi:hypothetical protein
MDAQAKRLPEIAGGGGGGVIESGMCLALAPGARQRTRCPPPRCSAQDFEDPRAEYIHDLASMRRVRPRRRLWPLSFFIIAQAPFSPALRRRKIGHKLD